MTSRGAKNLIFLTSRESSVKSSQSFLNELRLAGVRVKIAVCDISSQNQLSAAMKECNDMPPVKGCIQAAMLLRVLKSLFHKI